MIVDQFEYRPKVQTVFGRPAGGGRRDPTTSSPLLSHLDVYEVELKHVDTDARHELGYFRLEINSCGTIGNPISCPLRQ